MTLVPSKFDGWLKAELDEPTFTLMARDVRAPYMVRQWAYERQRDIVTGRKPPEDMEQVIEAIRIANAMQRWYNDRRDADAMRSRSVTVSGTNSEDN